MTTWVIGDIHGMHESLLWLLGELPRDSNDVTVFLGDYLDRGPDVAGVVETVLREYDAAPDRTALLWGNHEDMAASHFHHPSAPRTYEYDPYDWFRNGGLETLASYGLLPPECFTADCPEELERLFSLLIPYYHSPNNGIVCVHAGLSPLEAPQNATYETLLWSRENNNRTQPPGRWVIHGHTPVVDVEVGEGVICIDTGCFRGGPLTALGFSSDIKAPLMIFQAFEDGIVRQSKISKARSA
jgi:serine/threonine protein phosphatase 1